MYELVGLYPRPHCHLPVKALIALGFLTPFDVFPAPAVLVWHGRYRTPKSRGDSRSVQTCPTMRLLDTHTGQFVEKDPRKERFYLTYAILSHTWDAYGEQTYQELKKIQERHSSKSRFHQWIWRWSESPPSLSRIWKDRDLSPKIRDACAMARKDGYRYIWIDSCCIDKTSSSELSEAINSMYAWYKAADVCYAYLADVPPDEDPHEDHSAFRRSRWFTRGWTLQELIAPRNLLFLSGRWMVLGSKEKFADLVSAITGISVKALHHPDSVTRSFSVAQRLSWAASRETTREEDRAYSLLGLFDINMPTLYGEGEGAFRRLQEEILQRIPDQSIFAWGNVIHLGPEMVNFDNLNPGPTPQVRLEDDSRRAVEVMDLHPLSLLCLSPKKFVDGHGIEVVPLGQLVYHYPDLPVPGYSFTPHGIRTHMPLIPLSAFLRLPDATTQYPSSEWYLAVLGCEHVDRPGHLLGRVCHVNSSTSGINFLSRGYIKISPSYQEGHGACASLPPAAELVALSAEALARSSALARVVPVYLSHPDQASTTTFSDAHMRFRPHKTINLFLKKNDSGAPTSNADKRRRATTTLNLRWPDRDHPTTHCLTISRPASQGTGTGEREVQDTLTIEYTYTLEEDGKLLTIVARVSGTLSRRPIIPATSSWSDRTPWIFLEGDRGKKRVVLDNGEGGTAEVELSMEFLVLNHYVIDARVTEWCRAESPHLEEDGDSDSAENRIQVA
ncbi:hypothetical protein V8D89_004038 [Ganoderma adspersum]